MVFWEEEKDAVEEGEREIYRGPAQLTSATATWQGGPSLKWKVLDPFEALLDLLQCPVGSYSLA